MCLSLSAVHLVLLGPFPLSPPLPAPSSLLLPLSVPVVLVLQLLLLTALHFCLSLPPPLCSSLSLSCSQDPVGWLPVPALFSPSLCPSSCFPLPSFPSLLLPLGTEPCSQLPAGISEVHEGTNLHCLLCPPGWVSSCWAQAQCLGLAPGEGVMCCGAGVMAPCSQGAPAGAGAPRWGL